jgi:hypothetical protein
MKTLYVENHCIPFGQGSGIDLSILQALPAFKSANIVFLSRLEPALIDAAEAGASAKQRFMSI